MALQNGDKGLIYQEFVQRENEILRAPYNPELLFYSVIRSGDVERTREMCKDELISKKGLGVLSENKVQNMKFHFVITAALVARYCIEGGMAVPMAYNMSDYYINKADKLRSEKEISDLHSVMCIEYAKRMQSLRKEHVYSQHIVKCIDFIYNNLHRRITISELAEYLGISDAYLSRLFKDEIGVTLSQYIQNKKIETAENMLLYSDYSPADISSALAFPSQSYFTEIFRKHKGVTPLKFRNQNARNTVHGEGLPE